MPALTEQLLAERMRELAELGFGHDHSVQLARATDVKGFLVTIHEIRKAIRSGCSHELAVAIFG